MILIDRNKHTKDSWKKTQIELEIVTVRKPILEMEWNKAFQIYIFQYIH